MKKIISISLFIFWAIVTAIIAAGLIFYQKDPMKPDFLSLVPNSAGPIVLSTQEVAKHDIESDCWMIIDKKVYNLTSYIGVHPGGASSMLLYCGTDGSEGFATKDKKRAQVHSSYADNLLADYYIGDLNQTINQANSFLQVQSPAPDSGIISDATLAPSVLPASQNASIALNAAEVAKHNSTGNCWLVISGKVYNVTNYLDAHPGGVSAISPYCGGYATKAFQSLPHSSFAASLLSGYLIGNLNQTIVTQPSQQSAQNTNPTPTPTARRGRDYEEYDD